MEIFIVGILIVALMVYASTRIKRNAAAAFDAETIETDEFIIRKPDGFLNNLNGDPSLTLDTYSKDFGIAATNVRAGRVTLVKRTDMSIEQVVQQIAASDGGLVEDISEVFGPRHYRLLETYRSENALDCVVTYKIAQNNGKTYVLEAVRLAEMPDEFRDRVDGFVGSFELK